jgi:hypothetical protein
MATPMAAPNAKFNIAERLLMNFPRYAELDRSFGRIILGAHNAANKKGGNKVPPILKSLL